MATDMEIESTSTDNRASIIRVRSNDGQIFEIDQSIIEQSSLIQEMTESIPVGNDVVPLHNVNAPLFSLILEFCDHHKHDPKIGFTHADPNEDMYRPKRSDDMSAWDREFANRLNTQNDTLIDIINAANYLGITKLVNVGLKTLANMIRGKSATEVRNLFSNANNRSNK